MVDKVVNLETRRLRLTATPPAEADAQHDAFLIQEGIDLIAVYRQIGDRAVRAAMRDMIAAVVRSQVASKV